MSSVFPLLHESLQTVLTQRLGWSELREVQEQTYHAVIAGNDVLVIAPTAGGKSEAALIPILDDILKNGRTGVACLYLSPLKALINDQEERFITFCVPTGLSVMKWHGDVSKGDRSWNDEEPPHFLMITPESLEVLLQERKLSSDLRNLRYVIIDELHAFVESERGVHLKILLDHLDKITKSPVQRIGLSATTGNPDEVLAWMSDNRRGKEIVTAPTPAKAKRFIFIVEEEEEKRIEALVRIVKDKKALVFVNSRSEAEKIMKSSAGRVQNIHIHHSSLSAAQRKTAEEAFHQPDGACIICTSTLELGIDIGDLDVVVQIGPPHSVSSFLQRMGRSGRRGKSAYIAWICANPCELICSIAVIECAIHKEIEKLVPVQKPYNVLLQQIFLQIIHTSRISRKKLTKSLLSHPSFAQIPIKVLDEVIIHLIREGYLTMDGEMVMLGTEAERVFGRSNWKDLYSVISGGSEFRAITPDGETIGKLDARFVNSSNSAEFSLGGKSWSMVKCDEGHNIVVVVPGEGQQSRIFWTGGQNEFSPLVCNAVQRIISHRNSTLPLQRKEREILDQGFNLLPEGIDHQELYILERKGTRGRDVIIYSFYGSRFNRLLTVLLQEYLGDRAQVRYNDFVVKVQRAGKDGAGKRVADALTKIQHYSKEEIGAVIPMPPRENWKFSSALPTPVFREMVFSDYYHAEEFMELMKRSSISVLTSSSAMLPENNFSREQS